MRTRPRRGSRDSTVDHRRKPVQNVWVSARMFKSFLRQAEVNVPLDRRRDRFRDRDCVHDGILQECILRTAARTRTRMRLNQVRNGHRRGRWPRYAHGEIAFESWFSLASRSSRPSAG